MNLDTYFLSTLPLWISVPLIVILPTILCMCGPVLMRRWIGLDRLETNNEIAGFKFATVGVIYAVLLAFAVIVVWEKFSTAENAVDQEAASIAALFRYAEGNGAEETALRAAVANYANTAIREEWPAMSAETESHETTRALDAVYEAALALNRSETRAMADMAEVFTQIDNVTAARRVRLHLATGLVP